MNGDGAYKLHKIAKEWKAIPTVPEDLSGDELAPIVALPKVLPHAVAAYALRDMYQFCTTDKCEFNDWGIEWGEGDYKMSRLDEVDKYDDGFSCYSPSDDTTNGDKPIKPSPADICDDDSNSTGGGSVDVDKQPAVPSPYYYWLIAAMNAQGKDRLGVWIRDTRLELSGSAGAWTLLQGLPVHAPATPVRPPQPPMPTPSFAPASRGGGTKLKLDDSVSEVLDYSNGKLKANPPSDAEIGDSKSNPHLVYDVESKEMRWEEGSGQGCCPVLLYGDRIVTGIDTDGNLILGDAVATMAYPLYGHDYVLVD